MGKRDIFHEGSVHWIHRKDDNILLETEIVSRKDQKLVIRYLDNGVERTEKVRLKDFSREVRSAKQQFDILNKALELERESEEFDMGYEGCDAGSLSRS